MDELRNKIMSSIDDSSIPDLSYSIKTIYKDRMASKKVPWWKRKLTWAIALPSLTTATVAAIVLPLTVFKKNEQLVPVIPVVNQALPGTEAAYSISTLSLANAISANTSIVSDVSRAIMLQNEPGGPGGPGGYNEGWNEWDGWGYMPNGQNSLREVLRYCSQYMYVADKMLNNKLSALPDEFTHTSLKDGSEQYNCIFNKDEEFECSFDFNEKLIRDETEVAVSGVLGVKKNNQIIVEGSRKNVKNDEFASVKLDVKFEKSQSYKNWWEQKNPILSFRERINENNDTVYSFTYSENNRDIYIVEMSCVGKPDAETETYKTLEMNITTFVKTQTNYWPGAGYGYYYQPITYPFTVEKDENGLVLYLYTYGSQKLFIGVRDNNGYYCYYLFGVTEDNYFDEYGKH